MNLRNYLTCLLFTGLLTFFSAAAQDGRSQLPPLMQKSYFEVNIGSINYPFSAQQLEPGYQLQSVTVPHTAVRLVLFGYEFNKYLAAQITYMRPVLWVRYNYQTGGQDFKGTVWMNVAGLTIKPQLPIGKHFSVYGEGGLGIITRHGFQDWWHRTVVSNANYATTLWGAGLRYHLNDQWILQVMAAFSPANGKVNQPATTFISPGFSYHLKPVSEARMHRSATSGRAWPQNMIKFGTSSNILGYGVNNFLSEGKIPVFWGGEAEVRSGHSLIFQQNVFHTLKVFSLDWGINLSTWETNERSDRFVTVALFPVFRFNFLHTRPADFYFYYSVAGPCYISETLLDGHQMGGKFTFQDTMGTGVFLGKSRRFIAEVKISHYSNGNLFTRNDAVKIPLSLDLGYTF